MASLNKTLSAASIFILSLFALPNALIANAQSGHRSNHQKLEGGHYDTHRSDRAYQRQWERADHHYDRNTGSYNGRYNPDARHQRESRQIYRPAHNRHHVNRSKKYYNTYNHRNKHYYGTRHHGHNHRGYDHINRSHHSGSRYHIGGRYSHGGTSIIIRDYHRYGLRTPPRGHRWVRDRDNGDAILASVATGAIIGLVVGIIASEHDDHHGNRHSRRY